MLPHQVCLYRSCITLVFLLFTCLLSAQEPLDSLKQQIDSTGVNNEAESGRIQGSDSSRYEKQRFRIAKSKGFYAKIKQGSGKNFFSKQLYPLLFRKPSSSTPDKLIDRPANLPFVKVKGDIIRSIRIMKVDIFGASVFDTSVHSQLWLDKALNNIHFKTLDGVIRSYLMIQEGDRLDPLKLSDNERLIRQSALFEDARFIVGEINGSDSVDLILVVKDVFPLGFDIKVNNAKKSSFRLYNRNIFGLGHQIEQSVEFNSNEQTSFFFSEGAYKARNIMHSFTDARLYWLTRPDIKRLGIEVTKPFLTPEIRYGGGFNLQKTSTWMIPEFRIPSMSIVYELFDLWAGYSTIINRYKSPSPLRSQAALTMRYYSINYLKSPSLLVASEVPLVSVKRFITGFSLIKSGYFRSNMVFGYGKTEDIPFGHLAELIVGYETSILTKRYYTGIRLIAGEHLATAGYVNTSFQLGGFWETSHFTDGMLEMEFNYISRLLKSGSLRLRNYLTFSYTAGLNRNSPVMLDIDNPDGNRIFNNYLVEGNQRLTAHGETVIFTPFYLLGFRFAPFAFAQAAIIAHPGKAIFEQAVYPALGCGIRIKNENLVFSTFQFGFTWYARPDYRGRNLLFEIDDLPQVDKSKFSINAPEFAVFD